MQKLSFNIPGLELKVKLSSEAFNQPEKMTEFESTINAPIKELVNYQFKLISNEFPGISVYDAEMHPTKF